MPDVRILIEVDGVLVQVDRSLCSPATRDALRELVTEAVALARAAQPRPAAPASAIIKESDVVDNRRAPG